MNKPPVDFGIADTTFETVTLDKIRQRLQLRFPEIAIRDMGIEMFYDQLERQLAVRIERWFVGQNMPTHKFRKTISVQGEPVTYPATWRDAVKLHFADRWWMRWVVRKWPPSIKTYRYRDTFEVLQECSFDVIYPDFKPPYSMDKQVRIIVPREG